MGRLHSKTLVFEDIRKMQRIRAEAEYVSMDRPEFVKLLDVQ